MPAKKKAGAGDKKDIAQQEAEFFVIDEESLVNLTEHINGLSDMVDTLVDEVTNVRNDNDYLREQLEELEKVVRRARFNA